MPRKGKARLQELLERPEANAYEGAYSIEPHIAKVLHAPDGSPAAAGECYRSFIDYGRAFENQLSGHLAIS